MILSRCGENPLQLEYCIIYLGAHFTKQNFICIWIYVCKTDSQLIYFSDDYIAIGADDEELGSQIEEDILCYIMKILLYSIV